MAPCKNRFLKYRKLIILYINILGKTDLKTFRFGTSQLNSPLLTSVTYTSVLIVYNHIVYFIIGYYNILY